MYTVVEKVIAKAIPLWNATLTPLAHHYTAPPRILLNHSGYANDEPPEQVEGENDDAYHMRLQEWKETYDQPDKRDDEEWDDYEGRCEDWKENRAIHQPEPEPSNRPAHPPAKRLTFGRGEDLVRCGPEFSSNLDSVNLRKEFGKLQIIVKLANVHLTPEKPEYNGGSWHVEGQANEAMFVSLPVKQ